MKEEIQYFVRVDNLCLSDGVSTVQEAIARKVSREKYEKVRKILLEEE